MEPKEKAKSLIQKFSNSINYDCISDERWHDPTDNNRNEKVKKDAKKLAIIAIDEIVEQNNIWIMQTGKGTNNYWKEVLKELEKI